MKKKKKKTLLLLCLILLMLAGAYAAVMMYNRKAAETPAETTAAEDTVVLLSLESDVIAMTVKSENGTLEFVLEDEVWVEKNHQGYKMKQSAVGSMASTLRYLPASQTIEQTTDNLAEYGLDKPQYVVTAKTADGKEAVLYVGMKNTITTDYYVYTDEIPGVYTVGATSMNYFVRDLMAFAELPDYPYVTEGNFLSFETKKGEEHLKAEVLDESAYDMSGLLCWYVTEPFEHEYVAHTTTLDTIFTAVAALTYSNAAAYDPDEAELERMGLKEPQRMLAFRYKEEAESSTAETAAEVQTVEKEYCLYIGNIKEGTQYYYVQEKGSKLVLLMNKTALDEVFGYTAKDIVNKYFALINIDSVDSIDVVIDENTKYTMTPPSSEDKDSAADAQKDLYQTIISVHAEKVVDSQTGSFKMLPLKLTFHRNTEPSTIAIEFAEYDTSYYLAIVDGEGIYLVNKRDYNQYCEDVKSGFEGLNE